jgi:hypothetical protein
LPGTAFLSGGLNNTTGFAQGTATMQVVLPDGIDSITAQYLADTNYTASTSSAITVTVAPDFNLAFTGTAGSVMNIVAPGSSGTLTLTVTGSAGYNGTVNFTKCTGLPQYSVCTFNPASVTGSGSTTLTVTTTAAHSSRKSGSTYLWAAFAGFPIAGLFFFGAFRRRRGWIAALSLITLAVALTSVGCGGGSSGGGGGITGTRPGMYVVTATGADANFTHPVTFTLNVQ